MILTKEYRLVWDNSKIFLYGQFALDTYTETIQSADDFDTQVALDDEVIALGFRIPEDLPCLYGCTDPEAPNYDPTATCDDGSCILPPGPPA